MKIESELSAEKAFEEANEMMANDLFEKACDVYTSIVDSGVEGLDKKLVYNSLIRRAEANTKLTNYADAEKDADRALAANADDSRGYLKKGIALFNLNRVSEALATFETSQSKAVDESSLRKELIGEWIEKCNKKTSKSADTTTATTPVTPTTKTTTTTTTTTTTNVPPPIPKVKHEWYQSESNVTVSIFVKNVKPDDVRIEKASETRLGVFSVGSSSSALPELNLDFALSHKIVPDQTQIKFLSTKIEIRLKKQEGVQWKSLENAESNEAATTTTTATTATTAETKTEKIKQIARSEATAGAAPTTTTTTTAYPTSSRNPKNWDKIAADVDEAEKNEKEEGDSALNKLFQQVYANGTDETRKAMNKSFSESGGTVLSTNWSDVGTKKQDIKAPDGMEWKKWD